MIRIVLFEDNKSFRQTLGLFLASSDGVFLAGAYGDANEAVAKVRRHKPDVVLMDIQMPGISGIEAMQKIKAAYPDTKVLIQTVFEDDHRVFAAICGGASGYVLKSPDPDIILQAIRDVSNGGAHMSPTIAAKLSDSKVVATNRDGMGDFSTSVTPLTASATYSLRAYATNVSGTSYGNIEKVKTADVPVVNAPGVETNEVGGATPSSLNAKGKVTNNGSSDVTEYGFVYAEGDVVPALGSANKQTANNRDGNGNFTATLTGLGSGKTFSVRAYATNSVGTTYGAKLTGTTTNAPSNPPTVETGDVTNIGQTTASAKGKITNSGSSNVTEYGVCWVVGDATPAISNNKTAGGSLTNGDFTSALTGLAVYTTYSVRAYATNSAGTSYGVKKTFRTDAGRPTLEIVGVPSINASTATVSSKITFNGSSIDNVTVWGVVTYRGLAHPLRPILKWRAAIAQMGFTHQALLD